MQHYWLHPKSKIFCCCGRITFDAINMRDRGRTIAYLQITWFHTQAWYKSLYNSSYIIGRCHKFRCRRDRITTIWYQVLYYKFRFIPGRFVFTLMVTRVSHYILTHWGRDKMDAFSQTTNAFSWTKIFEFRLKFHWSLFIRVRSTIFQHWFR